MRSVLSGETNFKVRHLIKQGLNENNAVIARYIMNDYPKSSSFEGYSIYINDDWIDGCKLESAAKKKVDYIEIMIKETLK